MPVQITVMGIAQVNKRLEGIRPKLRDRAIRLIEKANALLLREVLGKPLTGVRVPHPLFDLGAAGHALRTRTGATKATVKSLITFRGDNIIGTVGSDSQIIKLHEFGGEVHGNPDVMIPTHFANTPGKRVRVTSRSGHRWIATYQGKRFIPLFLLKPVVKYRARAMFSTTYARMKGPVMAILNSSVHADGLF